MRRDDQKIQQVEDVLDGKGKTTAYTMDATWVGGEGEKISISSRRVGGPDPSLPLDELERQADIARARYIYAIERKTEWERAIYTRTQEFNDALITYYKKKHNLTDEDLERSWEQDAYGVFQKKSER